MCSWLLGMIQWSVKGDKCKSSKTCMNGKGKIITNRSYKRQHKCDSCMYCDL